MVYLLCFGKDFPDKLIMTYVYSSDNEKSFKSLMKTLQHHQNDTFVRMFLDEPERLAESRHYAWEYLKNDNYNIEDTLLKNYQNDMKNILGNLNINEVFIMKNDKWFQVNSPDFMFIPCEE